MNQNLIIIGKKDILIIGYSQKVIKRKSFGSGKRDFVYKILIIEDDHGIATAIQQQVEMWNLEALCITDFRNVIDEFTKYNPHLVLMDIGLPYFNGYHWCGEIRKHSKVPIIFISSASDNMNIVMAMNMGGDDFIAKPFDYNVLMAKIQAILRRGYDFTTQATFLQHKGAILNMSDSSLSYQEARLELTKNEYRMMQLLFENKEQVVSREKLMDSLWQTDSFVDENTLTVNVNRLRKRLEEIGLSGFVATKFGVGYYLT